MSPSDYFWLSLLIKAALTSTIIVTASLIVERGGAFLGAMIASLPTSVGAAYIVMSVEHSPEFIVKVGARQPDGERGRRHLRCGLCAAGPEIVR